MCIEHSIQQQNTHSYQVTWNILYDGPATPQKKFKDGMELQTKYRRKWEIQK